MEKTAIDKNIKAKNDRENLSYEVDFVFKSFKVRAFVLIIALIASYIIEHVADIQIGKETFIVYFAWLFTVLVYLFIFRKVRPENSNAVDILHFSYYLFGISFATVLAHYAYGMEWIVYVAYFFDLIYANILLNRAKGIVVTMLVALSYFTVGLMECYPVFLSFYGPGSSPGMYTHFQFFLCTDIVMMGLLFVVVSYSTGFFSRMRDLREKELLETKNKYEAKNEQLEMITKALRKKVAENKYIKNAAMGYVEKKEFEIEKTNENLKEQIENLRKTQKSMLFMIEDLNEMSAQLKTARDNLEEKVRIRSDELLEISRKLHRSERLAFLGKLSGSVTHELRNPMAILRNAVFFLSKKFEDVEDEKVKKYLEMIEREINIIDSIVDDIMGFAKTQPPEFEKTVPDRLIDETIAMITVPDMVNIKKEYADLPELELDRSQVLHALINLANNAIMAMKGNGDLIFRTSRTDDGYLCIEVEDTGPGISPEEKELIFEPLYSSKPKGTGLGLPIAKMMIENNDGNIEFESVLGKGTVFKIFLPYDRYNIGV